VANKLYSLSTSGPALSARGMLEHKGIAYDRVDVVPGMHPPYLRVRGFKGRTIPALVLDGRRVQTSRAIARALDEVKPDPPLFPSDPDARRRVEDAERWGDEVLQNVPRRIFRWMAAHSYDVRRWLAVDASGVPLGALMARPALQARAFAKIVGADDAAVRAELAGMAATLGKVEELRAAGVIGGDQPNAADFQIAGSMRGLQVIGDLRPYIGDHPAMRWAETVLPALPGPSPRALPSEWLAPLDALRQGARA
jgi:glutathione S-transferase